MPTSNVHSKSRRKFTPKKQDFRLSHVQKYRNTQNLRTTPNIVSQLKAASNRKSLRNRVRAQSRFNFLNQGIKRLNNLSNRAKQLSKAYNQSQKQKRNAHAAAQGTKVATFLQSKFIFIRLLTSYQHPFSYIKNKKQVGVYFKSVAFRLTVPYLNTTKI